MAKPFYLPIRCSSAQQIFIFNLVRLQLMPDMVWGLQCRMILTVFPVRRVQEMISAPMNILIRWPPKSALRPVQPSPTCTFDLYSFTHSRLDFYTYTHSRFNFYVFPDSIPQTLHLSYSHLDLTPSITSTNNTQDPSPETHPLSNPYVVIHVHTATSSARSALPRLRIGKALPVKKIYCPYIFIILQKC